MLLALSMNSGLRSSGTNGPKTGTLRAARKSSDAFFCASVSWSAGMSGSRSWAIAAPEITSASSGATMRSRAHAGITGGW